MCFGDFQRTQRWSEVERNENERGSEMRRGVGDGGETERCGGGGWEEKQESNEVGRQVEGREGVSGGVGAQVGRGLLLWGAHYVFHRRIWNPINQAEERKDAERMRSPFTLMRPGRGKRSTTWAPNSHADTQELWQYLHSFLSLSYSLLLSLSNSHCLALSTLPFFIIALFVLM